MNIDSLPRAASPSASSGVMQEDRLNPLVFTSINDVPENTRLGLGYHQLYDHSVPVGLIARLPEVCREGDILTLFWDNVEVQRYSLDQATIDKGWLSFNVSPSKISDANNQGQVYYSLKDPVAGDSRTSDIRTIGVNIRVPGGLDPNTQTVINENLKPAVVTPSVINSADKPVTVTVPIWENMEVGDELTVIWNGLRVEQSPLTSIAVQVVSIPKDTLEQGGSNAKLPVSYEIRDFVDNYSLPSLNVFADVEIDPNALTAPRVREANPNTLILDLVALGDKDAGVLTPNYAGVAAGDKVTLTWVGRTANTEETLTLGPETVVDPDFDPMPVFAIPNARLQAIAGGSAMASYEVLRTDGTKLVSKRTAITLSGLPLVLVAPEIKGVTGSEIDLGAFNEAPVKVLIAAYLGKQAGDKISLIWSGIQQNGNPLNYTDDHIVGAGEENVEHAFDVDRTQNLAPLTDGSLLLRYHVVFAGTTSPIDSEIQRYTVIDRTRVFEGFDGQSPLMLRASEFFSTATMRVTFVSGLGRAGFPGNDTLPIENPGDLKLPVLHVCFQNPHIEPGVQKIRIDLLREFTTLRCSIRGASAQTRVSFLTTGGALIETKILEARNYFPFTHTSTTQRFRFLEIDADKDWTRWDNFQLS